MSEQTLVSHPIYSLLPGKSKPRGYLPDCRDPAEGCHKFRNGSGYSVIHLDDWSTTISESRGCKQPRPHSRGIRFWLRRTLG